MQGTADFHHHVAYAVFPHPDRLFQHTTAFDTAIHMFDTHPASRELPVDRFLCGGQFFSTRLLRRLEDLHACQREPLKAEVLQQLTPRWQRIRRHIGQAFIVHTARGGFTQEHNAHRGIDQQEVFQHMALFLAAITRFLFNRVCGARDGSLGAVMTKRGATGGGALCPASTGDMSRDEDGTSTPRRACKASTLREGASPKVRRVLRNTGSKT